jgi:hypothetical protein
MPRSLIRAFTAFHVTLGAVILVESVRTAIHAAHGGGLALLLLAAVEAIGALLFLFPRTVFAGAVLMLSAFAVAFSVHALRGDFHLALLVFAAGTWLVLARRRDKTIEPRRT